MKRFNRDEYIEWMAAFALTGFTLIIWFVLICFVWDAFFIAEAEAAVPEAPAAVEEVGTPSVEIQPEEAVSAPSPIEIDQELKEQLAIVIYREAGGDNVCDDCRFRVADVALNRVADDRFPDTLAEVLTQKKQYGTMYWDGIVWPDRASEPGEAHAVERAYNTAEEVLRGSHSELYGEGYIFQSEFPKLGEQRVECCGIYYAKG